MKEITQGECLRRIRLAGERVIDGTQFPAFTELLRNTPDIDVEVMEAAIIDGVDYVVISVQENLYMIDAQGGALLCRKKPH